MYRIKVKKLGRLIAWPYRVNSHEFTNAMPPRTPGGTPIYDGPYRLELHLANGKIRVFGDVSHLVIVLGQDFIDQQNKALAEQKGRELKALASSPQPAQNGGVGGNPTAKPANVK